MFVTIIFDTEYMGMYERHKWFMKNLSHAKANNWLVITHEFLNQHYHDYTSHCAERFYDEFEMQKLNDAEYENICKGFVPDELFTEKEREKGSRSEFLAFLFQERYLELEQCLIFMIDAELEKRPGERVEGIFNCLDCFKSIKCLGEYYHCPVIPYVFSAIRKVHGYQQTLYMTSMDGSLFSSDDGMRRYRDFQNEKAEELFFSRRELLTLLGKENNIPLLKLLNAAPVYEMGICAEAYHVNHNYLKYKYTDDDIYYECRQKFSTEQIKTRIHPMTYDSMGIGRESLKNDPVSFILSCKRVSSVQSQMLLKAMLWNRTVYMKSDFLQLSFLCEKDIESTDKVDTNSLNYYIWGFLIPSDCMFDVEYWRWRINEKPSEHEIYNRHLSHVLKCLGLNACELSEYTDEEARFTYLLKNRRCSQELIDDLLDKTIPEHINYDVLYSRLEFGKEQMIRHSMNCINQYLNGKVYSRFVIDCKEQADFLKFYPFVDVGGKAKINNIQIDGICVLNKENYVYYPKAGGYEKCNHIEVTPGKHVINVEWEYSSN